MCSSRIAALCTIAIGLAACHGIPESPCVPESPRVPESRTGPELPIVSESTSDRELRLTSEAQSVPTLHLQLSRDGVSGYDLGVLSMDNWPTFTLDENDVLQVEDTERVVCLLRADGEVIWSEDPLEGGAPYFRGSVGAARAQELIDRWAEIMATPAKRLWYVGDSTFTRLFLVRDAKVTKWSSWHEVHESVGARVFEWGVTMEDVEGVEWSEDYRHFRSSWDELRGALRSACSETLGRPVKLVFDWDQPASEVE